MISYQITTIALILHYPNNDQSMLRQNHKYENPSSFRCSFQSFENPSFSLPKVSFLGISPFNIASIISGARKAS